MPASIFPFFASIVQWPGNRVPWICSRGRICYRVSVERCIGQSESVYNFCATRSIVEKEVEHDYCLGRRLTSASTRSRMVCVQISPHVHDRRCSMETLNAATARKIVVRRGGAIDPPWQSRTCPRLPRTTGCFPGRASDGFIHHARVDPVQAFPQIQVFHTYPTLASAFSVIAVYSYQKLTASTSTICLSRPNHHRHGYTNTITQ